MAWIRKIKRSPFWQLEWRGEANKLCRRTTGTIDKRTAEKILAQFERDGALKKFGVKENAVMLSIAEAVREYMRQKEGLVKGKTRKMDEWALRNFLNWLGTGADALKIGDVTETLLVRYRLDRRKMNGKNPMAELSDSSMAIEARHQRTFFNWCAERGWCEDLKIKIPRVKIQAERVRYLTLEEARLILFHADTFRIDITFDEHHQSVLEMRELFEFLMLTGARVGESLMICWGQIDPIKQKILIRPQTTKRGKAREIELSQALKMLLEKIKLNRAKTGPKDKLWRWQRDWPNKKFKQVAKKAGLDEELSIHCLRHTAASWMLQAGVPLKDVSWILGHSSMATTERFYAHLVPGNQGIQMDKSPLAKLVMDGLK